MGKIWGNKKPAWEPLPYDEILNPYVRLLNDIF